MADQCQWVSREQAQTAVTALQHSMRTHTLCEPCGETKAKEMDYVLLQIQRVSPTHFQVLVDDQPVDLAYTYTMGRNLAQKVGCPTEGVSATVRTR
ncbi:hypothetical protein D3C72_2191950 [compost metagenome]